MLVRAMQVFYVQDVIKSHEYIIWKGIKLIIEWMNEWNLYLKHGKNISITIENNEQINLK